MSLPEGLQGLCVPLPEGLQGLCVPLPEGLQGLCVSLPEGLCVSLPGAAGAVCAMAVVELMQGLLRELKCWQLVCAWVHL